MRPKDRDKFVKLANQRVNRVIKGLQLIGNLANRSNYSYTEEDIRQIFQTLKAELKRSEDRFLAMNARETERFRLE